MRDEGFCAEQGGSYLVFNIEQQLRVIEDTEAWSDTQIVVKLPIADTEGAAYVVQAAGLPSQPYGYEVPMQDAAPWPMFRRDHRNTANSPLPAVYQGDEPWSFHTGKGIFSTPVIDERGVIYVGSADHKFYALNADGTEKFRFPLGEIIDSAGALPRLNPEIGHPTVLIPSGDGHIYHL